MTEGAGLPSAFPLEWPVTVPRTPSHRREQSRFRVDTSQTRKELLAEMGRINARRIVLSSNIPLRMDGTPYSDFRNPDDPGVAIYWEDFEGKLHCIPCDGWRTVRENMRAATLASESFRALKRSKAGQIVDRAFAGLMLPQNAGGSVRPWWEVLGVEHGASPAQIRAAYRELARRHHPDAGGNAEAWGTLNRAYAEAMPSGAK